MNYRSIQTTWFVVFLGILMTFVYASFYYTNHSLYNSPDETAQAFFIERFSRIGSIGVPLDDSFVGSEYLAPRSTRIVNNTLVPASFLGLIGIYGAFATLVGLKGLYLIVGIIAVLGIYAFYKIVSYVWGENIGVGSYIIALLFPGWFYYASLAFFPNILFIALLFWSVYGYILFKIHRHYVYAVLSGILLSLSLFVRPIELLWIGFIWGFLFLLDVKQRRRYTFYFYVIMVLCCLLFFVLPSLVVQQSLYGGSIETGYVIPSSQIDASILERFFPGGIHPRLALDNVYNYFVLLFWYITVPSIFSGLYFFMHLGRLRPIQKKYFFLTIVIALWLFIYYGSWQLTDNINLTTSLGVAYVRYWLPAYLLAIPFAVYGVLKIVEKISEPYRLFLLSVLLASYVVYSGYLIYTKFDDSLFNIKHTLEENIQIRDEVIRLTEENAVIISNRHDKIFFPRRAVIHSEDIKILSQVLPSIIQNRPVYLYTLMTGELPANVIEYLEGEVSLKAVYIENFEKGALYEITFK